MAHGKIMSRTNGLSFWSKLKRFLCCTGEKENENTASSDIALVSKAPGATVSHACDSKYTLIDFDRRPCATLRSKKCLEVDRINNLDSNEIDADSDDFMPIEIDGNCLPEKTDDKPTLVLDLDNTLLFPTNKMPAEYTHEIRIKYNGIYQSIWFIERPYLQEFLEELHKFYEIVVFTAGIKQYGMKVIRKIDKQNRIKYLLDRRFCTAYGKNVKNQDLYVKNLSILGRDLKKTIIIDDREYSFLLHESNGQLIPPFNGDSDDTALLKLKDYLLDILKLDDFRDREYLCYSD